MRLFAFIVSFFILALSMVPCTDNHETDEQDIELSAGTPGNDHEDTCTPLCYCACCGCGGFVLSIPVFHISLQEVKTLTVIVPDYHSDFISSYFYSFWQPPKLG